MDIPLPALFHCDRLAARLTAAGCGRLFQSTMERPPRDGEARSACQGCAIGARNAGVDVEVAMCTARALEIAARCVRCSTSGVRLVHATHCVSCYNRLREAVRGRDARGRMPAFAASLHRVTIMVGSQPATFPRVFSRPEAIMLAAKAANGRAISIGWKRLFEMPADASAAMALPMDAALGIVPLFDRLWKPSVTMPPITRPRRAIHQPALPYA